MDVVGVSEVGRQVLGVGTRPPGENVILSVDVSTNRNTAIFVIEADFDDPSLPNAEMMSKSVWSGGFFLTTSGLVRDSGSVQVYVAYWKVSGVNWRLLVY